MHIGVIAAVSCVNAKQNENLSYAGAHTRTGAGRAGRLETVRAVLGRVSHSGHGPVTGRQRQGEAGSDTVTALTRHFGHFEASLRGQSASHVQVSRRAVRSLQLGPAALSCCLKSRLNPWVSLGRMENKGSCQGTCKVRKVLLMSFALYICVYIYIHIYFFLIGRKFQRTITFPRRLDAASSERKSGARSSSMSRKVSHALIFITFLHL